MIKTLLLKLSKQFVAKKKKKQCELNLSIFEYLNKKLHNSNITSNIIETTTTLTIDGIIEIIPSWKNILLG